MLRRPQGWLPSSHSDRWRTQVQYLHGRGWAGPNYGWARRHRLGASGARPGQSPATERRLRVRGHISTDDRFHAARKSRRGSNIVRPRVHIVCGGVERRKTRASWRKARRSCNRMRFRVEHHGRPTAARPRLLGWCPVHPRQARTTSTARRASEGPSHTSTASLRPGIASSPKRRRSRPVRRGDATSRPANRVVSSRSSSSRRPCTRGTAADSAAAVTDGQKTLSRSTGNEG